MALEVYMVKVSYNQKPYRRYLMEMYEAQVFASPTDMTNSGRGILERRIRTAMVRWASPFLKRLKLRPHRVELKEVQPGLGAQSRSHAPDRDR
jgi:hypothetical protein